MIPIPLKDNLRCKIFPIATLVLIALNCIAFVIELLVPEGQLDHFFMNWAVVPSKIMHAFAIGDPVAIGTSLFTVLIAMFLHGGFAHIVGNMIFLQAFGKSVEARMGSVKYAIFYVLGGYAAWGLHMISDPTSNVPAIGASGAIAAVLGAYVVFFPKADFKTLIIAGIVPIVAVVRAYYLVPAWIIMQFVDGLGGLLSPSVGGVAYFAHIGGALFGLFAAGCWLRAQPETDVCYTELVCACDCPGGKCKHNNHHKFRVLGLGRFRDMGLKLFRK